MLVEGIQGLLEEVAEGHHQEYGAQAEKGGPGVPTHKDEPA